MSMDSSSLTLEKEVSESKHYLRAAHEAHPLSNTSSRVPIYFMIKRLLDLLGAGVGIIALSPVLLLIAILIKINDPKGPIFFLQRRIGKNMKVFHIYKFRTMVQDAEQKLKVDPVLYKKFIDNGYKLDQDEDPRITRIGKFLRKTSLDELPQLINVLKGEMSLVGPRPVVREELLEYGERVSEFLSVKPGVTGYWQVSGRSDVGYPDRVDLELHYVYNKSVRFDIFILLKTVQIVLLKKGAY